MIRKSVFHPHLLLCLICALYIGTPAALWGQLSRFGLPKQQTEQAEIVTAHGVLSVNQVQPGSTFDMAIVMQFAPNWHANANPAGEGLIPTELASLITPIWYSVKWYIPRQMSLKLLP